MTSLPPIRSLLSTLFTALALAGCQSTGGPEADALTWQKGLVIMPEGDCSRLRTIGLPATREECLRPGPAGAGAPMPAVLFLHGCSGLNTRQYNVMRLFADSGYVVFAPDSFARPGRSSDCGSARQANALRFAEIEHGLAEMRTIPWIDSSRLVLAGFSAGGLAAAEYGGNAFRARVITGWGCGNGPGILGREPVLNLVGANDNETRWGNALCGVAGRPGSLARHVQAGHDVSADPEAQEIIRAFLRETLAPAP